MSKILEIIKGINAVQVIFLVTAFFFVCCVGPSDSARESEVEQVFLNGNWKFNTIYGQGSNPLNVHEQGTDIVIDNANSAAIEIKGNWEVRKEGERGSTFYGSDHLMRNFSEGEATSNYVRYIPTIDKEGYYEAFVMSPFATHLTAQINVSHAEGITPNYLSQRINCGQWISLGIYKLDASQKNYVEITAITPGMVASDAVMFRPISEEKFLEAKKQPTQVYLSTYEDSDWYNVAVPGHWGMINDFSNYTGIGWYRKEFELPDGWSHVANEKIRLHFDGVYHVSRVFLNGIFIGRHQGGFTPFEFEVSEQLKFGDKNVIAVEVDNNFLVGATWNWGGIIRDVYLEKNNEVRINNQNIHADPDLDKGNARINLNVLIENNSSKVKHISIRSLISKNGEILSMQKKVEVPANEISSFELNGAMVAEDVKLWHFDHPELYDLETTILENEQIIDSRKDNFGIRKVEITASKLLLNGEAVRLGGFNRVSEHRYWGSSEPLEVLEKDVDLMKEAGANFMRIMHGTQNKKLIELCDEKGILLFEEVNVRDLTNPEFTAPNYPLAKQWIKGMVQRDWNHPSIIGWSVGNELTDHYDYAKLTMDYVREMDPNRLVTCVSNSGQKSFSNRKTDPNTEVDIIMHNMYRWQGKPQEIIDKLRSEWPEKPIFISEYGFDPYPTTSLDGDQEIVSDWNAHWRGKNEFVIGASLWTFNDYRSSYAATTQEENRVWGLINVWRQKRRLFERISKEFSPVTKIEIDDLDISRNKAEVVISPRSLHDYPSYSLKGYQLRWKFRDIEGNIIEENTKSLPTIKPTDKEWKGELFWGKLPEELLDLRIQLVSPTGYVRYEKTVSFSWPSSPTITGIDLGDTSVRVHFDKVVGATEYFVRFSSETNETVESFRTISNAVEIENLVNGKTYNFSVFAVNGKGASTSANSIKGTPNGKPLPPKIWDAFISGTKLVIGYTSQTGDTFYNLRYGSSPEDLTKEFRTNVRGMMTVELDNDAPVYFQIQRENAGEKSNWSQIEVAGN